MTYKNIYDACNHVTKDKILTTIVDLGSRHGESYELFGKNHPDADFYFVEPSDRCIPKIKELIKKYNKNNLHLIDGVLGLEDSELNFYQLENDNDQSGNLFSNRQNQYGEANLIKVKQYDYRKIFSKKIDFVKCNIEGGEYELINCGFFDNVDSFVMEAHNAHVTQKTFQDILIALHDKFDMQTWGNIYYKHCFINGQKKNV